MSGPGVLCLGPALFASGPGALCRDPALFVSGPALLVCIGARRFKLGPGALCVGAWCRRVGVGARSSSLKILFVRSRQSVCQAPLCIRPRRFLSRSLCASGLALPVCLSRRNDLGNGARRSLCRGPAVRLSGPVALCIATRRGDRRSLRRAAALCLPGPGALSSSGALCQGVRGARTVSVLELGALLRRGPALCNGLSVCFCRGLYVGARRYVSGSVSGPGALCVGPGSLLMSCSPSSVGTGARRSSPFVTVLSQDSLRHVPAVCVSGPRRFVSGSVSGTGAPGAPSVGARRSFYRAPVRVCVEPGLLFCIGAPCSTLCVGARRSLTISLCVSVALYVGSGPSALFRAIRPSGPPAPIRVPSIRHHEPAPPTSHGHPRGTHPAPRAPSSDPHATHPAPKPGAFSFSQERTPNLTFQISILQSFLYRVT